MDRPGFDTTRWSVVLRARDRGAEDAPAHLCQTYWQPMAGVSVGVLPMSEVLSDPPVAPILLGGGVGLVLEAVVLWRSGRRMGRRMERAGGSVAG